ncbi:hypothetical protein PMAYCL1PPCAC_20778, partial [Pristionchus mayeri]
FVASLRSHHWDERDAASTGDNLQLQSAEKERSYLRNTVVGQIVVARMEQSTCASVCIHSKAHRTLEVSKP